MPDSGNIFAGEAIGINSDGTVIVGGGYENYTNPARPRIYEPWLWTEETGVVPLGTAKGLRGTLIDGQHYARDVSDDGSLVVGQDTLFNLGEQWAFIWTKRDGMNLLQDWVAPARTRRRGRRSAPPSVPWRSSPAAAGTSGTSPPCRTQTIEVRDVKIGDRFPQEVETLQGLEDGETVAVTALNRLDTGQKVNIQTGDGKKGPPTPAS